ncbi:hypothetical protein FD44_GL000930 [Secundilactobacillus malefermentans DSM 5705 = KCTC 3548]|nr:hypothetical protein FD44_GL000930 [Secundilactobacillus malefermentans DSM 5705 = KCTC 3548]
MLISVASIFAVAALGLTSQSSEASAYSKSSTPTFFLHGAGETAKTFNDTISNAGKKGIAKKAYTATVSSSGKVSLSGKWTSKNPMVHIIFKNNRQGSVQTTSRWINTVMKKVNAKKHFTKYNFVSHSKGSNDFMNYELRYGSKTGSPKLKTWVTVGGPFNGVLGWQGERANQIKLSSAGKPTKMFSYYQYYLTNRSKFPKSAKIANVYGDLRNGTDSDGIVSNQSSGSLKYLLKGRVKSYAQKQFTGAYASHSKQTHSPNVQTYVYKSLW